VKEIKKLVMLLKKAVSSESTVEVEVAKGQEAAGGVVVVGGANSVQDGDSVTADDLARVKVLMGALKRQQVAEEDIQMEVEKVMVMQAFNEKNTAEGKELLTDIRPVDVGEELQHAAQTILDIMKEAAEEDESIAGPLLAGGTARVLDINAFKVNSKKNLIRQMKLNAAFGVYYTKPISDEGERVERERQIKEWYVAKQREANRILRGEDVIIQVDGFIARRIVGKHDGKFEKSPVDDRYELMGHVSDVNFAIRGIIQRDIETIDEPMGGYGKRKDRVLDLYNQHLAEREEYSFAYSFNIAKAESQLQEYLGRNSERSAGTIDNPTSSGTIQEEADDAKVDVAPAHEGAPQVLSMSPLVVGRISSMYHGRAASFAIDGKVIGEWPNIAHTLEEENPYIDLDMGKLVVISKVIIWNRRDGGGEVVERLFPFGIFISDQPFNQGDDYYASQSKAIAWSELFEDACQSLAVVEDSIHKVGQACSWPLPVPSQARYVRLQLQGVRTLNVAEIVVMGYDMEVIESLYAKSTRERLD
jgi:hypothetical protein